MPITCPIKRKEYARQDYLRRREKILAENKTPEKRAKNNANLRAWKARNPEKSNAQKVAYRKRRAEREGRKYRTADQMAIDVAAAKKALVKKRMRRRLIQQWQKSILYMVRGGLTEEQYKYKRQRAIHANVVSLRMRVGIRKSLREYEGEIRWQEALGYTAQQLADHIESLFAPNMTWDLLKTGRIHIDHIKPKSLFSYASPHDEAFKECWAMSNLQPLWAEDNRAKRNYYEELINETNYDHDDAELNEE